MADLDDLDYDVITEMRTDDALEVLRQIRLSRRVPVKQTKARTKANTKKQKIDINPDMAAKLLEILGEQE